MSLLILLAAVIGIIVPSVSYAIPLFRNVEDIIPDIEIAAAGESINTESVRKGSRKPETKPLPR